VIPDFEIPAYWPRGYGMDVGWSKTAAIFGAWDRDNDTVYLTGEHYRGQAEPPIHAAAIKARGSYIPGFIDPPANCSSQVDGQKLLEIYLRLGLKLHTADNAREAGIYAIWTRLSTGRLKVFRSCKNWLDEFRIFARDENGKIINEPKFHLMAASRYLLLDALGNWRPEQPKVQRPVIEYRYPREDAQGWMN
jgi:hypothetical protein